MPKRLFVEKEDRDPIIHHGHYEKGDGDVMMKKTIRNYGPDDLDSKRKGTNNADPYKESYEVSILTFFQRIICYMKL